MARPIRVTRLYVRMCLPLSEGPLREDTPTAPAAHPLCFSLCFSHKKPLQDRHTGDRPFYGKDPRTREASTRRRRSSFKKEGWAKPEGGGAGGRAVEGHPRGPLRGPASKGTPSLLLGDGRGLRDYRR